jgi:lactate racemase
MKVKLGYQKDVAEVMIPDVNLQCILKPNDVYVTSVNVNEIRRALKNPIGTDRLKNIVGDGDNVCIVTSDITRPMPSKVVLPVLLEELYKAGIKDKDITIVFALGNHRKHTEEEKEYLVGKDIFKRVKCIDSDQKRTVNYGKTKFGTPVEIFEEVANADKIICLGNIEYHYFAGYSGGAKAIMPGVSTASAIQENHKRMVEETSVTGKIDGNNVRKDIEEAILLQKIDFILNVVLNEEKEVVKAVAGHYIKAHRAGCEFLDRLYKTSINEKADIVLVSAGGYPKDINLYQAQKALDNSKYAVKENGIIILLAACSEGLGEKVFERWMTNAARPIAMIKQIEEKFELGGHKAAAIGMIMEKHHVYLVSEMDDKFVEKLFFKPFKTAQEATDKALSEKGEGARVIVMPYGGSTLPDTKNK